MKKMNWRRHRHAWLAALIALSFAGVIAAQDPAEPDAEPALEAQDAADPAEQAAQPEPPAAPAEPPAADAPADQPPQPPNAQDDAPEPAEPQPRVPEPAQPPARPAAEPPQTPPQRPAQPETQLEAQPEAQPVPRRPQPPADEPPVPPPPPAQPERDPRSQQPGTPPPQEGEFHGFQPQTTPGGPPGAPATPPVQLEEFACGPLAMHIQDGLAEQFAGVQIFLAQQASDGTVILYGVLPIPELRNQVEAAIRDRLQNDPPEQGLHSQVAAVDASAMRADAVSAFNQMLPSGPDGVVQVMSFDPEERSVTLVGWVGSPVAIERVRLFAGCWEVDSEQIMVAHSPARPVQAATFAYAMATDALGRYYGPGIVYAANQVIRYGVGQPGLVARAWYLRAAGHILSNEIEAARADLKVAVAMDIPDPGLSIRYETLRRFQGAPRFLMEVMISEFDQPPIEFQQFLAPAPAEPEREDVEL